MGDMADYYIEQQLAGGGNPFGRSSYRPPQPVTCKRCGADNLKWRAEGEKWVLVENERVQPGNYKPVHLCPPAKDLLEGFE